jgi:protein-tyrosine phosphatase
LHVLFVCSRNQWRSPTAERVFSSRDGIKAKSAGTASGARIKLTAAMLTWADVVFVMERKHKQLIRQVYPDLYASLTLVVLDIEDNYRYMDDELVVLLEQTVTPYLDNLG